MEKNSKEEMPLGLGFGLAMNDKAMENFSKMPEEEKKQVIEAARCVNSKSEMKGLIDNIAGI